MGDTLEIYCTALHGDLQPKNILIAFGGLFIQAGIQLLYNVFQLFLSDFYVSVFSFTVFFSPNFYFVPFLFTVKDL